MKMFSTLAFIASVATSACSSGQPASNIKESSTKFHCELLINSEVKSVIDFDADGELGETGHTISGYDKMYWTCKKGNQLDVDWEKYDGGISCSVYNSLEARPRPEAQLNILRGVDSAETSTIIENVHVRMVCTSK